MEKFMIDPFIVHFRSEVELPSDVQVLNVQRLHTCKFLIIGAIYKPCGQFFGFFWPPLPPCGQTWTFWEPPSLSMWIFQWPPPLALFPKKFSNYQFIGILKSKHNTSYLWNIKLIHYSQIPDIKSKNVGIIIHMDRGLDPPPPMWTNMDILVTPPPPSAVPMVCRWSRISNLNNELAYKWQSMTNKWQRT